MRFKRGYLIGGMLLFLGIIGAAAWMGYQGSQPEAPKELPQFNTVAVQRGDVARRLAVPGELSITSQVALSFPGSGQLLDLSVKPGDTVREGEVLARLDTTDLEQAVTQARANLTSAQVDLERAQNPYSASDLAAAQAAVEQASRELENARTNLEIVQNSPEVGQRIRDLEYEAAWYEQHYNESLARYNKGRLTKERLDMDYNNMVTARERLERARAEAALTLSEAHLRVERAEEAKHQAEARLAEIIKGPDPREVELAQVRVTEAELALEQAKQALEGATLVAPFDGTVLDVKAQMGEPVNANVPVIQLADLSNMEVKTTVGEEDILDLKAGQAVDVVFDALPDDTFRGHVGRIIPRKASGSQVVTYEVYAALEESTSSLLPDMSCDAEIVVAEKKDVLILPKRAVKFKPDGTAYVEILQRDQGVIHPIEVGLEGDLYMEIVSGLNEGDLVIRKGR